MTAKESSPASGELQPLTFVPVPADPTVAVYRALVEDRSAPRSPVFALTVTIDASALDQYEAEFLTFLREMRAAFTILPGPPPADGVPVDGQPFDRGTQIQLAADLVSVDGEEPAAVAVTVATATGSDLTGQPPPQGVGDFRINPHGKDHHWISHHGLRTGTVTPRQGEGSISPPRTPVWVGRPGTLYAKEIDVHSDKGLGYNFDGGFVGP